MDTMPTQSKLHAYAFKCNYCGMIIYACTCLHGSDYLGSYNYWNELAETYSEISRKYSNP